jgi:hypothetical protein
MRLKHIEHSGTLLEDIKLKNTHPLSNTNTMEMIHDYYREALSRDVKPTWLGDDGIVEWRSAMSDWLDANSHRIPKMQLLDDGWRGYVALIHHQQHLCSMYARQKHQHRELTLELSHIRDQQAANAIKIERYLSGDGQGKGDRS